MSARRLQRERRRQRVASGDASRIVHGTWAAYLTDKCRCAECKAMKSAYMKAYRSKKKRLAGAPTTEGTPTQTTASQATL